MEVLEYPHVDEVDEVAFTREEQIAPCHGIIFSASDDGIFLNMRSFVNHEIEFQADIRAGKILFDAGTVPLASKWFVERASTFKVLMEQLVTATAPAVRIEARHKLMNYAHV